MFRSTKGAGVLCMLLANAVAAQQAEVAKYEAIVADLQARHADLLENAAQLDALMATTKSTSTIPFFGMTLTVPTEYTGMVQQAVTIATPTLRTRFGRGLGRLSGLEATLSMSIREISSTESRWYGPDNGLRNSPPAGTPSKYYNVSVYSGDDRLAWGGALNPVAVSAIMAARLEMATSTVLKSHIDPTFLSWAGDKFEPSASQNFRSTYRELVSSRFAATRSCRTNTSTCLSVLGLENGSTSPSDRYPGDDLRLLAVGWNRGGSTDLDPGDLARMAERDRFLLLECNDGNRASCASYLDGFEIDPPASSALRQSFLEAAFRLGGEGGTERLLESHGSTLERLEQVAGVPADQIIDAWLDMSNAAVGRPLTVPFKTGFMAIVWIGAFAGLGLRSTRWR